LTTAPPVNHSILQLKLYLNTIIMFADSKIIRERTQFRSLSRDSNELTIMIEAENETCYFERIIEDLKNGRIVDVFYNNQMKFDKYRSKLNIIIVFCNFLP
jgi:hypothetical protein